MPSTIKDIAKLAAVSTATVSNVLTQRKYVSPELEKRVHDAIKQLGYRPNIYARGLKTNRSFIIGIQIPDITNPYFGVAVHILQTEAVAEGYRIVMYNSGNDLDVEKQNIEDMLGSRVDGIICIAPRMDVKNILDRVHVPLVIVDRLPVHTEGNVAFVYTDNYNGSMSEINYLIEKGYRFFISLSGPIELVTNASERLRGIRDALHQHDIPEDQLLVECGEFNFDYGYRIMDKILDQHDLKKEKSAVLGGSDIVAWGAMEALKSRKVKIPNDVAVVGYDNIEFSNYLFPALTTVENPIRDMAKHSIRLMLDALKNGKSLENIRIMEKATLKVRNSG